MEAVGHRHHIGLTKPAFRPIVPFGLNQPQMRGARAERYRVDPEILTAIRYHRRGFCFVAAGAVTNDGCGQGAAQEVPAPFNWVWIGDVAQVDVVLELTVERVRNDSYLPRNVRWL